MARWPLLFVLAGCLGGPAPAMDVPEDPAQDDLRLERSWAGLQQPLLVTHDGQRTFVVEQCGRVLVAANGSVALDPWLDVSARVSCGGERGLLGLAFPPDHEQTRRFYISYTDVQGSSVLERFSMDDAGRPRGAGEILLTVAQPASNHNGGHIAFGPDGMLYLGLGDGGAAGDPWGNAQNPATLLGSILRLDVSAAAYTSPLDNPFVGDPAGRDEVWSYGWRNPWRFSFDDAGDMWIGDVGQDCWEEIDHEPAGAGGRNYGWPRFEGHHLYSLPSGATCIDALADVDGYIFPVAEVRNQQHCSITGGHVVRGAPGALRGAYVFGDYCSGTIWTLRDQQMHVLMETTLRISSFGLDAEGRLHVVDHQGAVHRFTG